jgi:hypothetical protein
MSTLIVHDSLVNFGLRRTLRAARIEKNHFGGNQHPVDVNFRQVGFRITSNSVVAANLLLNQRPPQLSDALRSTFLLSNITRRYFWPSTHCLDVLRDRRALLGGAFHPTEERFR